MLNNFNLEYLIDIVNIILTNILCSLAHGVLYPLIDEGMIGDDVGWTVGTLPQYTITLVIWIILELGLETLKI